MKIYKFILIISIIFLSFATGGYSGFCSSTKSPELTVLNYFEAFAELNFTKAGEYLHPNFLKNFKTRVKSIILRVKKEERVNVLNDYGVNTLAEFEKIPAKSFYSIQMLNHLNIDTEEKTRRYKALISRTKHQIVKSKKITTKKHEIHFKSKTLLEEKVLNKEEVFTLIKNNNEWQILNIARCKNHEN